MTDLSADPSETQPVKQKHPIRGVLWGLLLGLGLAIVLVVTTTMALVPLNVFAVIVLGAIAGTLWSIFGPAKQPDPDSAAADRVRPSTVETDEPAAAGDPPGTGSVAPTPATDDAPPSPSPPPPPPPPPT